MFKNLILIAFRNIRKDIGYSTINILGLTLGIASALFLIIYVADELSYDRYHEKADRIYRVSTTITETDDQFTWIMAQIPFGQQVKEDYPEIEASVRFFNFNRSLFKYEDKEFMEEDFVYADSTVFDVFSYQFIYGSPHSALTEPNAVVLTSTVANRYFGSGDPVGKSLTSGTNAYRVTGVIADLPRNSHYRYDALISRTSLPAQMGSWGNFGVFTYLLLPEDINITEFEEKINGMYDKYMAEIFERMNIKIVYHLEPITSIHLHSTNADEPEPTGSIAYVYIFMAVAFFLILIAAMNYMNLATARSIRRAREVGLRKVLGSNRSGLIFQFLAESAALTIIALIISLGVVALLLPEFNKLAGKYFEINVLFTPLVIASIFGIVLITGILGGSYPAFYLSRFSPVKVLKGEISKGSSGNLFRKVLVTIQFTVSVVMIISTLIVFRQLDYLKNKDLGYSMENIIGVTFNNQEMSLRYQTFKQTLLENKNVLAVTCTNAQIGMGTPKVIFMMESEDGMVERGVNFAVVDHDFIETMDVQIVKGRDFRQDMPADTLLAVVINETLAKRMNWDDPIGKRVEMGGGSVLNATVTGVIKDYHQTGIYNEIESLMLVYRMTSPFVYIKLDQVNIQDALRYTEEVWTGLYPDQPFSYYFLSDRFYEQFGSDEKRGFIFTVFTILAIVIASLGLFGLTSYMVEQRSREIGIRKVFGASELVIIRIVSVEFLTLVLIAIVLAVPVSYYIMTDWLDNFVYRTQPGVMVFVLSAIITIAVTFITVNIRAWKAAIANPVDSLRVE
ncbi:MAG: ABC transporter permease [Bacteroidales bacterium]